jgi:uncharacterized protein YndB with AHSA1/START domain
VTAALGRWPTGTLVGGTDVEFGSRRTTIGEAKEMKPEINVKSGLPPTRAWDCAAICVTRRYDVPPARVFDAWLDPEVAGRWLFATASRPIAHVQIDARVEGSFCFVDRRDGEITEYTGEYIEIVPPRRLVFTLCMERQPHVITRVKVEIAPLKQGCELTLIHENVPQEHANDIEGRWTGILYGLDETLDAESPAFHHDQE